MRCIVIDKETGRIVNFIEADPFEDKIPDTQLLVPGGTNTPGTYDYMLVNEEWVLTPEAEQAQREKEAAEQDALNVLADAAVREAWA